VLEELLAKDDRKTARKIHDTLSTDMKDKADVLGVGTLDHQPLLDAVRAATYFKFDLSREEPTLNDEYKTKIRDGFVRMQAAAINTASKTLEEAAARYEHYKQLANRIKVEQTRLDDISTKMSLAQNENQPGVAYYVFYHLYENYTRERPMSCPLVIS